MSTVLAGLLLPLIVAALTSGLVGAVLGTLRGRFFGGLLAGTLLGPFGWLLVLVSDDARRRPCTQCGEAALKVAVVCPYCRSPMLPPTGG